MNLLLDFEKPELAVIGLALQATYESAQTGIEQGLNPPDGFIEALEGAIEKFQTIVEARIKSEKQFDSIAESLADVNALLNQVINETQSTENN